MQFCAVLLMNLNLLPKDFLLLSLAGTLGLCPLWYLQNLSMSAALVPLLAFL